MFPFLSVGRFKLPTRFLVFFAVYMSICILSVAESSTIGVAPQILILLSLAIMMGILIFARAGKILVNSHLLLDNYKNILKTKGLVSYGGIVGVAIAIFLFNVFYSLPIQSLFRFVGPIGFLVGGIFRTGCFFGACCLGKPTNLRLGIKYYNSLIRNYPNISLPEKYFGLHPFALYESVLCFAAFFIFFFFYKIGLFYGKLIFMSIATYSAIRFCTEFFRDAPKIFCKLTLGQIISLFLGNIFLLFIML